MSSETKEKCESFIGFAYIPIIILAALYFVFKHMEYYAVAYTMFTLEMVVFASQITCLIIVTVKAKK